MITGDLPGHYNLCYRYIDDLIVFKSKKFSDYLSEIYPSQLTAEKASISDHLASYFDLTFINDKRNDFNFHIVNVLFLFSNILALLMVYTYHS